ncbi:uncharacterized protein M6B38_370650 [Iris pallida]|uniref:Uncharacterized protein n=1 Tax=Iris pallida TaxID=29817 RepID=A0AAX6GEI1_IRIPA|nr:uncharacterized protein M6B38_370650 [Iris pallida]
MLNSHNLARSLKKIVVSERLAKISLLPEDPQPRARASGGVSMILTEEYGVRVPIPMGFSRGRPTRRPGFGSWGPDPRGNEGDCRICDLCVRIAGGGGGGGGEGKYSSESEHDLGVMVSDFLENGSGGGESKYSSDSDSGCADLSHLAERILFHKRTVDQYESDLSSAVRSILLSITETDLQYVKGDNQCNASCIRQSLVKRLRLSGYDAAVCSSRWQGFDKVPGGDHEYVDVVVYGNVGGSDRFIIDIDFRSHFEIARAVESYDAILTLLPVVYVGPLSRLEQFLRVMVDAAKYSLKQNSMPLPPWRSLSYLHAKWHSKFERRLDPGSKCTDSSDHDHGQCAGHFRRLKASLQSEIETERFLKPITNDKKRVGKLERRRFSLLSS